MSEKMSGRNVKAARKEGETDFIYERVTQGTSG